MTFSHFPFISCVVIHNNMTLKPLIWWNVFEFFPWRLKKKPMVTEMCLPFSSNQWDWMLTEISLNNAWNLDFSEHSMSIQWTFRNNSVDWKENFHPVQDSFHLRLPIIRLYYTRVYFDTHIPCCQTWLLTSTSTEKIVGSLNKKYNFIFKNGSPSSCRLAISNICYISV